MPRSRRDASLPLRGDDRLAGVDPPFVDGLPARNRGERQALGDEPCSACARIGERSAIGADAEVVTDAAVDLEREVATRGAARDMDDSWKEALGERGKQFATHPVLSRAQVDTHHRGLLLDLAAA